MRSAINYAQVSPAVWGNVKPVDDMLKCYLSPEQRFARVQWDFFPRLMAYHKELVRPVGWAPVSDFQPLLFDSCRPTRGSPIDPVLLHFHFHLKQHEGQTTKAIRFMIWIIDNRHCVLAVVVTLRPISHHWLIQHCSFNSFLQKLLFNLQNMHQQCWSFQWIGLNQTEKTETDLCH